MKVRNKEHQSLGLKQLQELCDEFPNDQMLGEELRRITNAAATTNNPQGTSAYEPKVDRRDREYEEEQHFEAKEFPGYRVFGKFPNA